MNEKTVLTQEDFCESISQRCLDTTQYVTEELVEELELLEPFGKGNTQETGLCRKRYACPK